MNNENSNKGGTTASKGLKALGKIADAAQATADDEAAKAAAVAKAEADAAEAAELATAKAAEDQLAVEAAEQQVALAAARGQGKTVEKTSITPVQDRIDARVEEAANAADTADAAATLEEDEKFYYFVSPHPEIVVFIDIPGRKELDRAGNPAAVSSPVAFKNGVYRTNDYTVAALLDERARTLSQLFRRERNPRALAVLQEAHKEAALIKSGVVGGISTAGDDNPQESAKAQEHLKALRNKTYNAGVV